MAKKYILYLFIIIFSETKGQFCNLTATNMGGIVPTGVLQTVAGASGARRYWTFTATAGCTYTLSTCGSPGANDTFLRLYSGTNPATALLVTSNDDNGPLCAGNKASIVWVCPTTGAYSVLLTNWSCANLSASTNLQYRVVCGPVFNPCTGAYPTLTCGINTTWAFASGSGAYNPPANTCGFATPGQEKIYVFTPTVTGTYNINQISSFGFIDYFFKPVSAGCNGTGWTCIQDLLGLQTSVGFVLTAGVQYFILQDPETTGGGNVTFNISCPGPPFDPCTGAYPTLTCGVNQTWNVSPGNGAYNPPANTCGFATPGQEKIYSFTPPVTGNYTLNQISSFNWIDYFFKPVSGGCNGTGWTCIDDLFGNMASVGFNLTAGVQYYIMLDPEVTTGGEVTFNVSCLIVLPIDLSEFKGTNHDTYNYLYWKTISENNNQQFGLERSIDALNWTIINTQAGGGQSQTARSYEYKDYEFEKDQVNYYRLFQKDFNGAMQYFNIIAIEPKQDRKCEEYTYYDLLGKTVDWAQVPEGIYLRKCGNVIEKVIKQRQ